MIGFIKKYDVYVVLALAVLWIQAFSIYKNMDYIRARTVSHDNDGYWHLLRVQEIHRTGSWDNEINPRGNAPFGERIHWTHAMDLVLWAGATVGSVFTDFDTSLYWWGVFLGPFLFALSLIVLLLCGRALFGTTPVMLGLLFVGNLPQWLVVFSVNRPDHHCLVAFMYVLYYCLFIILLERPQSSTVALLVGLAGALGLWCSLELVVFLGLFLFYLASLWLVRGERYLKANFLSALALSVCLMITVLLDEKPSSYWTAAYDKRSIVHVTVFACAVLFWLVATVLSRIGYAKTVGSRLMIGIIGATSLTAGCLVAFPELIHGPMAKVDPRLYDLYLSRTGEFGTATPNETVYSLALVIPGFIYLARAACKNEGGKRVLFSWLALTIGAYSLMVLTMGRWVYTLAFMGILPTTFLLIALWNWEAIKRHPVVAFAATIFLLCGPLVPLFSPSSKTTLKTHANYRLKLTDALAFVESQDYTRPGETILADICAGPAIMYHTSLNAVGTPNHNNDAGITDTYRIVTAEDDKSARAIIEARGIDYILVDELLRALARVRLESFGDSEAPPTSAPFIERLSKGQIPEWLVRRPLTEELADTFTLYQVVTGGSGSM